MKIALKIVITFFLVIALVIGAFFILEIYERPNLIVRILKIDSLPKSVEVHDCAHPMTTDVINVCAISIDPADFPELLKGYDFKSKALNVESLRFVGPPVGEKFMVSKEYMVEPEEFEHGGFVRILVNKHNNYALIDEYIE